MSPLLVDMHVLTKGNIFFCPVMCHVCPVEPCTECRREMPSGQEMCTDSKQMTSPPVYVHRILMHTWLAAKVLHKQGRHETEANIFSFNKGEYVEEEWPSLVTLSAFPKIDRDDVRRVPLCVVFFRFTAICLRAYLYCEWKLTNTSTMKFISFIHFRGKLN